MSYDAEKMKSKLPVVDGYDWKNGALVEVERQIVEYAFTRDGLLFLSCEREHSQTDVADYYGEFRGGRPWINPELREWAESHGMFWEWQNAASIVLHP